MPWRHWPDGPVCPHCGTLGNAGRFNGKAHRIGVWKCRERECRKQFTVKVGTVFESAHIPLHKMLQAVHLLASSKKGISSHQLHRTLEITYKSAWFLSHRIREAMREGGFAPMGGLGSVVEIDETLSGRQKGSPKPKGYGRGYGHQFRNVVLTLVERGGKARSFHVDGVAIGQLIPIIRANINRETTVMTDSASWYKNLEADFRRHESVNHEAGEYVTGGGFVHSNTVENYYSIFKRGMKGVYQHCSEKHLHRYLAEFDFRYSQRVALGVDDGERAAKAMKGIVGKRLTYRGPRSTVVPFPSAPDRPVA